MDGRISIAMNIYGDICSIHKPGGAGLAPEVFGDLFQLCQVKAVSSTRVIRELLRLRSRSSSARLRPSPRECLPRPVSGPRCVWTT